MTDESDFKWTDKNTVVRAQLAIAVYTNQYGEVVIRQADYTGDDSFIAIARANIPAVVAAMLKEVGIGATFSRPVSDTQGPKAADRASVPDWSLPTRGS
jgi:hypothetical protein